MRTSIAALAAVCLALAAGAAAAEKPKAPQDESFLMSPVGLPIVVNGQVVNYVFVTLRVKLSPKADPNEMRALEPVLRDALVRTGGRAPFVRPDNYMTVDRPRVIRTLVAAADAAAGKGAVVSAEVVKEQAQRYSGLPKPGARP